MNTETNTNQNLQNDNIDAIVDDVCSGHDVSDARRKSLRRAVELGASQELLAMLRDATRLRKDTTIVLPSHRYEGLSRGRGWARLGSGPNVTWGDRVDGGYEVGPGRWTVGATDGFSRKDSCTWNVKHVQVGPETWTVAE